jgi:hypothetical protein
LTVIAESTNCPDHTESQVGPSRTRAVRLRRADFRRRPDVRDPR